MRLEEKYFDYRERVDSTTIAAQIHRLSQISHAHETRLKLSGSTVEHPDAEDAGSAEEGSVGSQKEV